MGDHGVQISIFIRKFAFNYFQSSFTYCTNAVCPWCKQLWSGHLWTDQRVISSNTALTSDADSLASCVNLSLSLMDDDHFLPGKISILKFMHCNYEKHHRGKQQEPVGISCVLFLLLKWCAVNCRTRQNATRQFVKQFHGKDTVFYTFWQYTLSADFGRSLSSYLAQVTCQKRSDCGNAIFWPSATFLGTS